MIDYIKNTLEKYEAEIDHKYHHKTRELNPTLKGGIFLLRSPSLDHPTMPNSPGTQCP